MIIYIFANYRDNLVWLVTALFWEDENCYHVKGRVLCAP